MNNLRRGPIPSDIGWLADYLDAVDRRLTDLETPDGVQNAGTLAYLKSLKTYGFSGPDVNVPTIINDATARYVQVDGGELTLDVPTLKMLVTASVGEASLSPNGSFMIGYVTFTVRDANGDVVPGGSQNGRLYTDQRLGLSISTGPQYVAIADPVANPGPYTIRLFIGTWAATGNGIFCTAYFSDPSLVVQIIGEGVGL